MREWQDIQKAEAIDSKSEGDICNRKCNRREIEIRDGGNIEDVEDVADPRHQYTSQHHTPLVAEHILLAGCGLEHKNRHRDEQDIAIDRADPEPPSMH